MNRKLKIVLWAAALALLLAGSYLLYRFLGERYRPEDNFPQTGPQGNPASVEASGGASDTETSAPPKVKAPDFTVSDGEGNAVRLSDFLGQPVVLNFWASWCGPCKAEMPGFDKAYGEQGEAITFLMVNATDGGRETKEKAESFLAEQGYRFPAYFDLEFDAVNTYGVTGFPTTLFIDREGYVAAGWQGQMEEEMLKRGIDLIAEETDMPPEATSNPSWCDMEPVYSKITPEEARDMMADAEDYILLDVRAQEEYREKRIDGALLIPDGELAERAEAELPDKKKIILVYCRSGRRSEAAARLLVELGYNHVYDFGGLQDWPYDTVSG